VDFYLCFAYCNCTVVLIVWMDHRSGVSAVRSLPVPYSDWLMLLLHTVLFCHCAVCLNKMMPLFQNLSRFLTSSLRRAVQAGMDRVRSRAQQFHHHDAHDVDVADCRAGAVPLRRRLSPS